MRVDVRALSAGPALDWLVARAVGYEVEIVPRIHGRVLLMPRQRPAGLAIARPWSPSTDWSQCGPLIARLNVWAREKLFAWINHSSPSDENIRRVICIAAAVLVADADGHAEVPDELAAEVAT